MSDGAVIGGKVMRGIRVWISNLASGNTISPPSLGSHVAVSSICASNSVSGKVCAQIKPRLQADMQVIAQ